ncbi:MAG: TlpA family protein disulfide reductase [Clostridia bacterium]|nr:TlpA family protein disulfide reductase [Clostridia bacterium]
MVSGKLTVICLFCEWSEECKNELEIINELYDEYFELIEFYVVADITEEAEVEKTKQLYNDNNYDFKLYFDLNKVITQNYNIIGVPTTIILDKTLNSVDKIVGEAKKEELVRRLEKYLDIH